jgi:SAM-dependent methyltransferase
VSELPDPARTALPAPYADAAFAVHRRGIFDDEPGAETTVYLDADRAFAALHPRPAMDYAHYAPRQARLGLSAYKAKQDVINRRLAKIGDLFPETGTVLEVGAADGAFLKRLLQERPVLQCIAVEPDRDTGAARAELPLGGDHPDLAAAQRAGHKADIVCLFHVFEHIAEPRPFIDAMRAVLAPGGRIVIEVPSLDDPLLSLYGSKAYDAFYFQRQHPFVYSGRSLARVLTANGLRVREIRPYQRYGLENHLAWLTKEKPGGDARLAGIFAGTDAQYRSALEAAGQTDTVFAVAEAE